MQTDLHVLRQLLPQLVRSLDPELHADGAVRDDQPVETFGLPGCGIARHQHAAPALSQDVKILLNPQMVHEIVEFVHEEVLRPERGVAILLRKMSALSSPELVVEDDRSATG